MRSMVTNEGVPIIVRSLSSWVILACGSPLPQASGIVLTVSAMFHIFTNCRCFLLLYAHSHE